MTISEVDLSSVKNMQVVVAFAAPAIPDLDILAGPCTVWSIRCDEKAEAYVAKLFNSKNPTLGTTAADAWISVAIGSAHVYRSFGKKGLKFPVGLSVVATDTALTSSSALATSNATFFLIVSEGVET